MYIYIYILYLYVYVLHIHNYIPAKKKKTVKQNAFVASVMARPSRSCPTSFTESQEIQAMDSDLEDYHRKNTQLQVVVVCWFGERVRLRFVNLMLILGVLWTLPSRISQLAIHNPTKRRSVCYSRKKKMTILQSFPQRFAIMMNIVDTDIIHRTPAMKILASSSVVDHWQEMELWEDGCLC